MPRRKRTEGGLPPASAGGAKTVEAGVPVASAENGGVMKEKDLFRALRSGLVRRDQLLLWLRMA